VSAAQSQKDRHGFHAKTGRQGCFHHPSPDHLIPGVPASKQGRDLLASAQPVQNLFAPPRFIELKITEQRFWKCQNASAIGPVWRVSSAATTSHSRQVRRPQK